MNATAVKMVRENQRELEKLLIQRSMLKHKHDGELAELDKKINLTQSKLAAAVDMIEH